MSSPNSASSPAMVTSSSVGATYPVEPHQAPASRSHVNQVSVGTPVGRIPFCVDQTCSPLLAVLPPTPVRVAGNVEGRAPAASGRPRARFVRLVSRRCPAPAGR
jgi:hypothetical protein